MTLRTSIIGPELKKDGEGLFQWVLNQKNVVFGYKNVYWSGITTLELSRIIYDILEQNFTGLINLTNGKKISKYNLIKIIKNEFGLKFKLESSDEKVCDKSLVSVRDDFKFDIPSYEKMIQDLKTYMS